MDLWSHYIVGWNIEKHIEESLIVSAFQRATRIRRSERGLIVHTDGGGQYASKGFRKLLSRSGYDQSMTRRDNHYDNAFAESLFSRLKAEMLDGGKFVNIEDARIACFDYIEGY